jgi:hypothetical protein
LTPVRRGILAKSSYQAQEGAAAVRGKSAVGRKGGRSGSYTDWTVPELKMRAKELGISGYSGLTKEKLVAKLRNHSARARSYNCGASPFVICLSSGEVGNRQICQRPRLAATTASS